MERIEKVLKASVKVESKQRIPECFKQKLPEVQRLIAAKSPEEVFQQEMYCVSNITNGIRVYRGGESTYLEYSLKGVNTDYAIRMLQSFETWNEWNMSINEASLIN